MNKLVTLLSMLLSLSCFSQEFVKTVVLEFTSPVTGNSATFKSENGTVGYMSCLGTPKLHIQGLLSDKNRETETVKISGKHCEEISKTLGKASKVSPVKVIVKNGVLVELIVHKDKNPTLNKCVSECKRSVDGLSMICPDGIFEKSSSNKDDLRSAGKDLNKIKESIKNSNGSTVETK